MCNEKPNSPTTSPEQSGKFRQELAMLEAEFLAICTEIGDIADALGVAAEGLREVGE